jgi:hypothetical protein
MSKTIPTKKSQMRKFNVWDAEGVPKGHITAKNEGQAIQLAKRAGVRAPMVQLKEDFQQQVSRDHPRWNDGPHGRVV